MPCRNCGSQNWCPKQSCPARGEVCNWCGKVGHFEAVCIGKRSGRPQQVSPSQVVLRNDSMTSGGGASGNDEDEDEDVDVDVDEDEEAVFQDPALFSPVIYADLVDSMALMFPALERHVVRKVVYANGKDPVRVVDELLRLGDASECGKRGLYADDDDGGCREVSRSGCSAPWLRAPTPAQKMRKSDAAVVPKDAGDFDVFEFLNEEERISQRCNFVRGFLPDACPKFVRNSVVNLGEDEAKIQEWLDKRMTSKDYPKLVDYLKEKEFHDTLEPYRNMSANRFLQLVPSPVTYYRSLDRLVSAEYRAEVGRFLRHTFPTMFHGAGARAGDGDSGGDETPEYRAVIANCRNLLVPCVENIEARGHKRRPLPTYFGFFASDRPLDLAFLQEFTYVRLERDVKELAAAQDAERAALLREARAAGTLQTCPVCFDEEVLSFDVYECSGGGDGGRHGFCRACVVKHAEACIRDLRPRVKCLRHDCSAAFPLADLGGLLPADWFRKLVKEEQAVELRNAGLEELEECPFCPFRAIVDDPTMKIFRCMNSRCRVDSCRTCKQRDHGDVPCGKVEYNTQLRARIHLEEKLSKAVIRECPACKTNVVKIDGCNHMECACGSSFCYRCRKPLPPNMPCKTEACLEIVDPEVIHSADISRAAEDGKSEVRQRFGRIELVHDPTVGI